MENNQFEEDFAFGEQAFNDVKGYLLTTFTVMGYPVDRFEPTSFTQDVINKIDFYGVDSVGTSLDLNLSIKCHRRRTELDFAGHDIRIGRQDVSTLQFVNTHPSERELLELGALNFVWFIDISELKLGYRVCIDMGYHIRWRRPGEQFKKKYAGESTHSWIQRYPAGPTTISAIVT